MPLIRQDGERILWSCPRTKCGHEWHLRQPPPPKQCPKC